MATNLNVNPIHVEGVMATSYKSSVATTQGTLITLLVTQLRWLDVGAVGDELLIVDPGSGQELVHEFVSATRSEIVVDWSASPRLWRDFQVVQIGSGRLDIYTK